MQRWADSTCTCSTGTHLRSPGRMRESLAPLPAHSASACPLRWAAPILRSGSPLAGTPCSVRATRRLASSRGRRAGRPRRWHPAPSRPSCTRCSRSVGRRGALPRSRCSQGTCHAVSPPTERTGRCCESQRATARLRMCPVGDPRARSEGLEPTGSTISELPAASPSPL